MGDIRKVFDFEIEDDTAAVNVNKVSIATNEMGYIRKVFDFEIEDDTAAVNVNKVSIATNEIGSIKNNHTSFSSHPNLEEIRVLLEKFSAERDWNKYHQPRNLLLALVGEVGELAELFQWRGEVKEGLPDWSENEKEHLSQELSDVLLYLVRLSDKCHIDLPAAVLKKISMNAEKYPVSKVHGSNKKYTEYN